MKIPSNPARPGAIPPDEPKRNDSAGRTAREGSFRVPASESDSNSLRSLGRVTVSPEWNRADLVDPGRLQSMLRDTARQLVESSPVAQGLAQEHRAELERVLMEDPLVRELLTQHLEQELV